MTPKCLSHQAVKIRERGKLVTETTKDAIFHQVWLPFMILDTISDEVYTRKQVYLHFLV